MYIDESDMVPLFVIDEEFFPLGRGDACARIEDVEFVVFWMFDEAHPDFSAFRPFEDAVNDRIFYQRLQKEGWDEDGIHFAFREFIGNKETVAKPGPLATCVFQLRMDGAAVSSGMGTCGLVGQIGVFTGWVADVAAGTKTAITSYDWLGLLLISFIIPAVLSPLINAGCSRLGWVREGDMKL